MTRSDEKRSHLGRHAFLQVFADDTLDIEELQVLEELALADRVIDEREKNILRTIFDRATPETVTPEVWLEIESFRQRYDV